MVMPAGKSVTVPALFGKTPVKSVTLVDRNTATDLNRQLSALNAKSNDRVYFDFDAYTAAGVPMRSPAEPEPEPEPELHRAAV